jgi:hypothetical protein
VVGIGEDMGRNALRSGSISNDEVGAEPEISGYGGHQHIYVTMRWWHGISLWPGLDRPCT